MYIYVYIYIHIRVAYCTWTLKILTSGGFVFDVEEDWIRTRIVPGFGGFREPKGKKKKKVDNNMYPPTGLTLKVLCSY